MSNDNHAPDGFTSVTPCLMARNAQRLVEFIKTVFEAVETDRTERQDGVVMHVSLRVGDAMIEISEARPKYPARDAALHVYVADSDATYARALDAGATSVYEPADMPYGERSGGVEDDWGNYWYIATMTE